jgi:glycosyltransferase involved in cell wall biosynthesis
MMVRNEGLVIERCLASVLPLVDGWVIADTGSTDATRATIVATTARWSSPGLLVEHPWRNFGVNRTRVAQEARQWVAERGWPAHRTYLLLLDADMVLRVSPSFDKELLHASYYQVRQNYGTLEYWNTRLACLSHEWFAVGSTHEYWETRGEYHGERLDALDIDDRGDGGSKGGKLMRDYTLLKHELALDPRNARQVFYLAQTCFDGRRFREAAKWYERRCAMDGWDEERWYARYRLGLALLNLGDSQRGAGHLMEAFDERPWRAEPLWALARHHREHGRSHAALVFLDQALQIPFPVDDTLFVDTSVYEYRLLEELAISAWYVPGRKQQGFAASERLLLRRGHDDDFYSYVASNATFYHEPLPRLRSGCFDVDPALLRFQDTDDKCANPTVVRLADRVVVNVRLVNYEQQGGQCYLPSSSDDFRTRNVTLDWETATGMCLGWRESRGVPDDWPRATNKLGLEDMRWTLHDGRIWFTATCYQTPGAVDQCRVVLGRMSEAADAVDHLLPLQRDGTLAAEKNWLPWSYDGQLHVVYAYDPFEVRRVDLSAGRTELVHLSTPPFRGTGLRGSAPPVPIPGRPGRWLLLTHEVAYRPHGNAYAHRFIEVDIHDGLTAASRAFHFEHVGIEYAAGLCDLGNGRLLLTFGLEDREARWVEIDWDTALAWLGTGAGASASATPVMPPASVVPAVEVTAPVPVAEAAAL